MKSKIVIIFLVIASLSQYSCKTSASKRAADDSGMMFGMIYDFENMPVSGVEVSINGAKLLETDIQGRFVFEFKKAGYYTLILEKKGYERVEEIFKYDPMNVLYIKMINASQLASRAEEAADNFDFEEAESFIDRALVLEPLRPDINYLKAIILYLQKKEGEVKTFLENALSRGVRNEYIVKLLDAVSGEGKESG